MKKMILLLILLLPFIQPVAANHNSAVLLIPSSDDTYYVIANQGSDFQILAIPKNSAMPIPCLHDQITDTADFAENETAVSCIKEAIGDAFSLSIDHHVLLDTEEMADQLDLKKNAKQDQFEQIITYFNNEAHTLSLKDCYVLYQSISTDLSIFTLYDYYQLFTDSAFHYEKQMPFFLYAAKQMIPLSYLPK